MNRLLVICGPTAVGKTSTGIKLAKKFDGEIISADSRQVYKGMDIGTGKDIKKSSKFNVQSSKKNDIGYYKVDHVPVWLLDMATPDHQVTVADWLEGARRVIAYLDEKGKLPILVGGTGFYIKAFLDGIDTLGIPPDEKLRQKLAQLSVGELKEKLKKLAADVYQSLNQSDRQNPHRLIRKIEIAQSKKIDKKQIWPGYDGDVLKIGLKAPKEIIYQRIDQRVEKRLDQGLLKEIQNLIDNGYNWDDPGMNTLAYKEFKPFFTEVSIGIHLGGVLKRWRFDEHGYARRQLTWFKADDQVNWFDITNDNWLDDLEELVHNWLNDEYVGKSKKS